MRQIFKDRSLEAGFIDTGYVHVPMLSLDELGGLLADFADLRPDDGFAPSGEAAKFHTYHCSFLDTNLDYRAAADALIRRVFAPHVARYLHGYEILNTNFYVKPPGTGYGTLHQNWPAIPDLNDTTVTVWCPLTDVARENGTLQFVVGSHKLCQHIEGPGVPGLFRDFHDAVIEKYLTPIPMKAGEAAIFDDSLVHWAARNESDQPRIAVQIMCKPVDATPVYFYPNPEHPGRFELIAADSSFWISAHAKDLLVRQPHWVSLGFVDSPNRYPSEVEFVEMLRQGPDIRRPLYARAD